MRWANTATASKDSSTLLSQLLSAASNFPLNDHPSTAHTTTSLMSIRGTQLPVSVDAMCSFSRLSH